MSDTKAFPTPGSVHRAANLDVYDQDGTKVCFGTLFESQKAIFVFIRHFFCGSCQQYVIELSSIPQETLEEVNTRIVVIGCGEWQPIRHVLETTDFRGPIYADPTRKLYHTLGMNRESLRPTEAGIERKSYLRRGFFCNLLRSIWSGPLKHPSSIGKQGNIMQLGGEFIFGPGSQCTFASRMQHTEDHTEVAELMQAAGVAYP